MSGYRDSTHAGNKDRHQSEGAHLKEHREPDRETDPKLFLQRGEARSEPALRVHRLIVSAFEEVSGIENKTEPGENRIADPGSSASELRQTEESIHEESVHRSLQRKHQKRNPHRNPRLIDGSVDRDEDPIEKRGGNSYRGRDQVKRSKRRDAPRNAAEIRPEGRPAEDPDTKDREQQHEVKRLIDFKTDLFKLPGTEMMTADRREPLHDADEQHENAAR